MNGTLSVNDSALAYADVGANSNPKKRYFDWSIQRSYQVANPKSLPYTVDPGATFTLFSGTRATSLDNTTEFQLTASAIVGATNRYRFTWDTVGTAPVFRTDRNLTPNGHTMTMTANANQTETMTSSTVGDFAAVQVGDWVFLPDPSTGDAASPFSPLNTGYWTVLSKDGTSTTLQLARLPGVAFSGTTEVVAVTSNTQVWAFSAAGVQVGDSVSVSAGFSPAVFGTYAVVAVTSKWFEVIATQPLPVTQTAVPGTTGMQFYNVAKRWFKVEYDQVCVLRINGDTTNNNTCGPWSPADGDNTGWHEKVGPTWSLVVVNLTQVPLNVVLMTAE